MPDKPWKVFERALAKDLGGKRRIERGSDYSISTDDVEIPDFPHMRVDCKYSASAPFRHHTLLKGIERKYCKHPGDIAILATKSGHQHGSVISMSARNFALILDSLRARRSGPIGVVGAEIVKLDEPA